MRALLAIGALLLATTAQGEDSERYIRIDDSGPAKFYLTSCTANPTSAMGRIPAGTRLGVVEEKGCRRPVDRDPNGQRRSVRLGYTLPYFKVEWEGGTVWISSGTVRDS